MIEAYQHYAVELKQVASSPRKLVYSTLNLGCVFFSVFMFWKLLMVSVASESPVVAVMSGSMEPGFFRGDILILEMWKEPVMAAGDITVFNVEGTEIPIVHRTLNIHQGNTEQSLSLLTKGDNNQLDDRTLYNRGQDFLARKNMMGRARFLIPHLGIVTIWMNDYPWFKIVVIGMMCFFVMIGRE